MMMTTMRGASSWKLVPTTMLWAIIWLVCSSSSNGESSRTAEIMDVGVPSCSPVKIRNGDPIAGAIVALVRKLLSATPKLINHPKKKSCYRASYGGVTAYGAVSCFKDIAHCETCLDAALDEISWGCSDRNGGRVTMNNCFMRFESYKFC